MDGTTALIITSLVTFISSSLIAAFISNYFDSSRANSLVRLQKLQDLMKRVDKFVNSVSDDVQLMLNLSTAWTHSNLNQLIKSIEKHEKKIAVLLNLYFNDDNRPLESLVPSITNLTNESANCVKCIRKYIQIVYTGTNEPNDRQAIIDSLNKFRQLQLEFLDRCYRVANEINKQPFLNILREPSCGCGND